MEDNKTIPYYAYDALTMLTNRTIRRLWILCIILVVLLVGSNVGWLVYEAQYEDVVTTTNKIETESDYGDAIGIIGSGNGVNGESKSNADNNEIP
jgi:hypothetical protein